jgi:hypothetical protein
MKILNICCDDYANFSHDNANALRSVGIMAIDIKLVKHVFNYKNESDIVNEDQLKRYIEMADLIQIFHSDSSLLKYCKGKRTVVYHTGTRYRQHPDKFNALFNPFVERSFIALGEFAGLGSKNETYIVGATEILGQPSLHFIKPLRFAHYPSNPDVKGSHNICRSIDQLSEKILFHYSSERVSHAQQLERMKSCDVYIEMNSAEQGGKKYGSWGITTLEAASLAKIVITNHSTVSVYEKTYGVKPPLVLIEDYGSIEEAIKYLLSLTDTQINNLKNSTLMWVNEFHSYQSTGNYLKRIYGL